MKNNIYMGSLFAIIAFLMMAVFGLLTKAAIVNNSTLWVSFISYLTGTVMLVPYLLKSGVEAFRTDHFCSHLGRVCFGLSASFLYTVSLNYIPIVNATLLFNTAPIFIPILCIFMMGTSISKKTWISIFIGFAGIIVIIKPTPQIFQQSGDLIGLASGVSLALAYVFVKILSSTDPLLRIVFYYFFGSTLIQLPFLFFFGEMPSLYSTLFAIAAGAALWIAQLSLVKAYSLADASDVGIFQYASVIFVGLIEWLIWGNIPPFSDLFGVILVIVAGVIIIKNSSSSHSHA